jgi:uncharacterized membrane protein YedE/YeeE
VKSARFLLVSFLCGLVFAVGLGLSGMTQPAKVLAFLDIKGAWDPTLMFVMVGAIAVHMGFALRAKRATKPVWAPRFSLPAREGIDAQLFAGAALFGVGWGLEGYCPGPAVVASASGHAVPLVFVASMIVGLLVPPIRPPIFWRLGRSRRRGRRPPRRRENDRRRALSSFLRNKQASATRSSNHIARAPNE